MNDIKLFNVDWATNTAGPSPFNNERTEIFLKGCKRAASGNPCPGCFNSALWSDEADHTHNPVDMANQIAKFAPNKYVTIGGGEPTDQLPGLIELCQELKSRGFHIMVYTWKSLQDVLNSYRARLYWQLLNYIDMLVDGEYKQELRVYDDANKGDGFLNSIGSGNQIVWSMNSNPDYIIGYPVAEIDELSLSKDNKLEYWLRRSIAPYHIARTEKGVA